MGQYFVAVNRTKRQYVSPYRLDSGAKLVEWCAGPAAEVLVYLLRRSTETGGGDLPAVDNGQGHWILDPSLTPLAGSWAGDDVSVVGDYDESGDYQTAYADYEYTDISLRVAKEYNQALWGYERIKLEEESE